MKTHIDTLLILAVCGFPLASVYDSDSSNRAILIQNEDLNTLQTTGSMNDTLSDTMSVYMVIKLHVQCAESSSLLYTTTEHVDAVVPENNDTQCNTILLDNIIGH